MQENCKRRNNCDKFSSDTLKKLISVAEKSNVNQRHSCALIVHNSIIVTGFNKYTNNNKFSNTVHAEIDALFKMKNLVKNDKKINSVDLLIIRLSNYNNSLKNSKPCHHCINYIKKYNEINKKIAINRIYYSNECGDIVHESIVNLKNNHISSAYKVK